MTIKTASPGVIVNEVDLTRGGIDAITQNVGAFAGPFQKGPVGEAVLVNTEEEFIRVFGLPTDENYEYWWSVSNFLEYGGICYVVRCDDAVGDSSGTFLQTMKNATDIIPAGEDGVYVKNVGDFVANFQWGTSGGSLPGHFLAKNPGTWGNSLNVAVIDRGADFRMSLKKSGVTFLIDGSEVGGTFGGTVPGAVRKLELLKPGKGFGTGSSIDVDGGSGENLAIVLNDVNDEGPVTSISEIKYPGLGYKDANDLATTGGSGTGLTVNIESDDSGYVERISFNPGNNYEQTLTTAGLKLDAKNVPLGLVSTGGGSGLILTADFSGNSISSLTIANSGAGVNYKVGDTVTITTIAGIAVNPNDNPTDVLIEDVYADGSIKTIYISSPGSDYRPGDEVEIIQPGTTANAIFVIGSVDSYREVEDYSITNAGSDYEINDIVTLDPQGGAISESLAPLIVDSGSEYTPGLYFQVPIVSDGGQSGFGPGTSGQGATATVEVDNTGSVTSLEIANPGFGYNIGDSITVPGDRIGGEIQGRILELDLNVGFIGGGGYPPSESFSDIPVVLVGNNVNGATGATISFTTDAFGSIQGNVTVQGSLYSGTVISDPGVNYREGDELTVLGKDVINTNYPNGAPLGSGFRVRVGKIDGEGSGFVAQIQDVVSSPAEFKVVDVTKVGDKLESGSELGQYVKVVAPGGLDLDSSRLVRESTGGGALEDAFGHIINYENGAYQILMGRGEFTVGSYLTLNGRTVGPITGVFPQGEYLLYSSETDFVINTIWVPNSYTAEEGNLLFKWPAIPVGGQKAVTPEPKNPSEEKPVSPSDYGDSYTYNPVLNRWIIQYTPEEDDLISDGTYMFRLEAHEDWYRQQVAFAGVPWYRFAPRPTTTKFASDLGASNDEVNLIIYDATGELTGSRGNVLETYAGLSKFRNATTPEGDKNYYVDVINLRSNYVFANRPLLGESHEELNDQLRDVGTNAEFGAIAQYIDVETIELRGGVDNLTASLGELQVGYETYDKQNISEIDYIIQGPGLSSLNDSVAKANFLISIVESRRDCMTFLSPPRYMVIGRTDNELITDDITRWADEIASSSYAVLDSGYKYQYDRFGDKYRYVPMNGDVAGLLTYASLIAEPWFSPAGLSRGQIRNVINLPYNPGKTQRDQLYTSRVNPITTFPGEGTILFGDRTALAYTSAFDRINVRRLFLVLEKAIAKAARAQLFEFNDEITRSLFKNIVNPYLRDVLAKRGMYDFLVVCDASNNTPEVIDRNEFIADIYIKPTRSINYITLNFIATKTGVTFDESVALFRGSVGGNASI